jgi:hypothetical protein
VRLEILMRLEWRYGRRAPVNQLHCVSLVSLRRPTRGPVLRTAQWTVRVRYGYWVCMSMHDLPGVIFTPKRGRYSQIERGDVFPVTNFCPPPLSFENGCKVSTLILSDPLEVIDLAISEPR